MPMAGLEPARRRRQWILSPPRLPIPTHRLIRNAGTRPRTIIYYKVSNVNKKQYKNKYFTMLYFFILTHVL